MIVYVVFVLNVCECELRVCVIDLLDGVLYDGKRRSDEWMEEREGEKERGKEYVWFFCFLFFLALISKYRIGMGKPVAGKCQPSYLLFHRHLLSVMQRQREKNNRAIGLANGSRIKMQVCQVFYFFPV